MLNKINKIISILLTIIFIAGIFPPVIFAEPNQVSLGEVKGFNKAVIDSHFSKADRELNPEHWLAEAKFGITQAICAWELIAGNLYDNPLLYEEAKAQIEKWSDEELEKRFSQWLMGRFFGKAAEEALINLSSNFSESQKNYSWHLDKDGNIIFDEKTGDPLVIRPNDEGREFSHDLALWHNDSNNILKNTNASFDNAMIRLYPELLAYIPEESRESMTVMINETLTVQRNVIKQEFESIAAREERIFTNRRTRDIWSLRKKSDDEAAKIYTEKLIAETDEACKRGIEELNTKIEQASAGVGDLAILGEEWLRLYKEQFERGLKAWEEAEERFFIRRIEWEQDSFRLFGEGEEIWLSAFNQFEEGRQKWELDALELFRSGENLFSKISEDFEKTVASAKKEFELNVALRTNEGTNKVKALIDIYLVYASTTVSLMDNIKFWQNQYGNSEKNIREADFFDWISEEKENWISLERGKSKDSKNKLEILTEIERSYNLYLDYSAKSLDARNKIYENYADLFKSGALKDILSPNVSSDDFFLDEYQVALLRAKALVLYWQRKTEIADAVMVYAEDLSAGRMTEAEGLRAWEEAKAAYNNSLAVYETELSKLNGKGEAVREQLTVLNDLTARMQEEENKLYILFSEYSELVSFSSINMKDYYQDLFNERYKELVKKYEDFQKKGIDSVYYSALKYAVLLDVSEQKEAAENISDDSWQNTYNSLSLFFNDYSLEKENNIFPDIQLLCQEIFKKSGDFIENTVQFLLDFDNCFSIKYTFLQYEIDNWKDAFIEYITILAVAKGKQSNKNTDNLTKLKNNYNTKLTNLIYYISTNADIDNETLEQKYNEFVSILNELNKLDYMEQIIGLWESINSIAEAKNETNWRQYLININTADKEPYFSNVSLWIDGAMEDSLFFANFYTNRVNEYFNLFTSKNTFTADNTYEEILDLYKEELNIIFYDFNIINSLHSEIIKTSEAYKLAALPSEEIKNKLNAAEKAKNNQEAITTALREEYKKAADVFIEKNDQYDYQYNILTKAYNNTDQKRFEYEKQDAIQKWASSSYINTDGIDPDNCRASLKKAQTVLTVLSDISNSITYENKEYDALFSAYEQSFINNFKANEAAQMISSSYTQERIYNENIYKEYHNKLFELGINFNYEDYKLPDSKKDWKIENIITVKDGRLVFSRNDFMSITGINTEQVKAVIDFFNNTNLADGERFEISAFEEALRGLSQRMSEYFKNPWKFEQWGLARNYLLSSLISANYDPTVYFKISTNGLTDELSAAIADNLFLLNSYISLRGELDFTGSLYSLPIKRNKLVNQETLGSFMKERGFNIINENLFYTEWSKLSAQEKADLEFYTIMTLTAGNDYFAGFSKVYTNLLYQFAYDNVYLFYRGAQNVLNTWYLVLDHPNWIDVRDINKNTYNKIWGPYSATYGSVNYWKNGLKSNLNSINNLSSLYNASCIKLDNIEGKKEDGQNITWTDLQITFSLSNINTDDISILKTCWEDMEKNNSGKVYQDVFSAFSDLIQWTGVQAALSKNNLETRFAADMRNKQLNEASFLSITDNYLNGTAAIKDVKTAAEKAYGKDTISSKYYLDNMYEVLINNLSMYMSTDFNFSSFFGNKEKEMLSLTEDTINNKYNAELAAREAEWNLTRKDIAEKYNEWQNTAAQIFENGRTDWIESYKKLENAYKQWNANFKSEYERVNNEWAYAYLAGLEDKEKWLEQAADAVNQASSEAFLSLVGAEGERLARFMDTREPFGIRDAVPEAQALMASLLQSSGIINMASAFNSINNYTGVISPLVKQGIGGSFSWDSAVVRAAASVFAREANAEIAKNESKKLAYSVRLTADEAVKGLYASVDTANQNFRESMDNMFIFSGLWRKSGNGYEKDIIKGSTLFNPVVSQIIFVSGYSNYIMESITLKTNLDDNYLAGLNSIAIQVLINNVYTEVKTISGDIFGNDQKPLPISNNREQSPGKFGAHIGYAPANKQLKEATKKRSEMFYDEGSGELGHLMADFQYWQIIDQMGSAELAIAPWDKRIWNDDESWFTAPTLRSVGTIAVSVVAGIATGGLGFLSSVALNSGSDIFFGMLDVAGGYKSFSDVSLSIGKSLITSSISLGVGGLFSGMNFKDLKFGGLTDIVMGKIDSPFGKVLTKTFMTGAQTFTTGTVTNAVSAVTYNNGKFGFSEEAFNAGFKGTLTSSLTSVTSAFTTNGLTEINSGLDYSKLKGFNKLNKADLQKFNGLIGSLAGQGVNYALGNDFTLNVMNLSLLTQNDKYSGGLLELHLGNNGVNMNFGTGGANISIDNLAAAFRGAQVWNVNTKINNYGEKNNFDALIALRVQYGYGDTVQKEQLWDILNGKALINTKAEGDYFAETTINEDGKRVINLAGYKNGMSEADQFFLGVVLGYEAYRDGYTIGQTDASGNLVTYTAQSAEFQNAHIAKLAMGDRIQEENKWFYEKFEGLAYESSLLGIAQSTNNMSLFNDYMELVYDNSKDYLCISAETKGDYQNKYYEVPLFNSVLKDSAKETEINAQRLQAAFERYNANKNLTGDEQESKKLYDKFIKDKDLQKDYGYNEVSTTTIADVGCMFMSTKYLIEAITGHSVKTEDLHKYIIDKKLFSGDNLLSKELMAAIITSYTNNEYNVAYNEALSNNLNQLCEKINLMKNMTNDNVTSERGKFERQLFETLNNIKSSDEKYVIHLRIKEQGNDDAIVHSVAVSSIDFTYDNAGKINGIKQIIVANPLQNKNLFNGKSSYSPSDILRWDIFLVTQNKK
jgi:hypothetical protein